MYKDFIDFSAFVATDLFIPSQDYDAVSSEEHQNSGQVLVPQELPVPDFQGRIFFFFTFKNQLAFIH